jgi:2-polyprenyl-3-methyl-5-hydroxy-6-metoxy-1,4-benzoquinol methylase
VCGNSSRAACRTVYTIPEFDVLRCRRCLVTFIDRVLDNNAGYAVDYAVKIDPLTARKAAGDFVKTKALLRSLGLPTRKGLRLLDVGCGIGTFLLAPQQEGWQVEGIELNPGAARWARENNSLDVYVGSIEATTSFPSGSFDVVTMFGVIEHLAHPTDAVKECCRILSHGGILVLQTPTEDGFMRRVGRFMFKASRGHLRFQVKQLYQMGGGHSVCFDRRSIRTLVEGSGLEIIKIRQSTYGLRILMVRFAHHGPLTRIVMTIGTTLVFWLGRMLGLSNHMTVYARKKMSLETGQQLTVLDTQM